MSDPLQDTREFVERYWGDAVSRDAVAADLRRMVGLHRRGVREGADAIEALLADPPQQPGTLLHLVAWDGNYGGLNSGTDEEAADWLREFVAMARAALADSEP